LIQKIKINKIIFQIAENWYIIKKYKELEFK
jgi:hypothetical protein